MNWIAYQPLIGGMAIGAAQALGCLPKYIISDSDVANNKHLINYWKYEDKYHLTCEDENLDYSDIDIVIGVPICSGLSLLNACNNKDSCKARGADAEQNDNMKHMTEYTLGKIKPKVYVFENAPALYTKMGKPIRDYLIETAKKYDYSVSFVKTDTYLHGIPQNRKRTFAFFWKSKTAPIVNWYKAKTKNLVEYFQEIPNNALYQDIYFFNLEKDFYWQYLQYKLGSNFREVLKKENCKTILVYVTKFNLIDDMKEFAISVNNKTGIKMAEHMKHKYSQDMGIWDGSIRYFPEIFNAVVSRNLTSAIHPIEDRPISAREFLWLMGMPHDFDIIDIKKNWNMIAQNVCTHVAKDYVTECKLFIEGKLRDSGSSLVMQNNEKQKIDYIDTANFDFF